MRWYKKPEKILPEKGKKRAITKFLLFPKCIKNEWRWLETATWIQQYKLNINSIVYTYDWFDLEWVYF